MHILKRKGVKFRTAVDEIFLPPEAKFIVLSNDAKSPIELGNLPDLKLSLRKEAQTLTIYHNGLEVDVNGARMSPTAAVASLVARHGLTKHAAATMLKEADTASRRYGQKKKFLVKYAQPFQQTPFLQTGGPSAPAFPQPTTYDEQVFNTTVRAQPAQDMHVPIPEMSRGQNNWKVEPPDPQAMQAASAKHELEQNRKAYDERKKDQETEFQTSFGRNKEAYQKNLKRQNEQYKWTYDNNARAQRESVNIQKEMLTKELAQNQAAIVGKVEHYQQIKEDPFYRIENRGTELYETPSSYVLTTYVPAHEKDNVKIKVHSDRAAVEGVRSFQENRQEEDRKMTTNSFQTFREEFKFEKPVIPEAMERSRSGDYVRVEIPKMASRDNKASS
jgi:HSP20 family molecular chaperone IbpA